MYTAAHAATKQLLAATQMPEDAPQKPPPLLQSRHMQGKGIGSMMTTSRHGKGTVFGLETTILWWRCCCCSFVHFGTVVVISFLVVVVATTALPLLGQFESLHGTDAFQQDGIILVVLLVRFGKNKMLMR